MAGAGPIGIGTRPRRLAGVILRMRHHTTRPAAHATRRGAWTWVLLCAAVATCGAAAGAEPEPQAAKRARLTLPILKGAPALDGDLSDAFWGAAAVTGRFVNPDTGQPATASTVAKVAATSEALYLGFLCLDAQPKERLEIRLYPMAAFGPSAAAPTETTPKGAPPKGKAKVSAKPVAPDWRRCVRIAVSTVAKPRVRGATTRVSAAWRRLAGGVTVEVRIPLKGLVPKSLLPRRGDLWAANLARRSGDTSSFWSCPRDVTDPMAAAGSWVFGAASLLANGGAELWRQGAPKGWRLEALPPRKVLATRDWGGAIEGTTACRVIYRGRLMVRPALRVALRPGAMYRLSVALHVQPGSSVPVTATLSAAPSKAGRFQPAAQPMRVDMPFRAKADFAAPALTLVGKRGAVVIDDFRLEMMRP